MSRLTANQSRFAPAIRSGDADAFRAFADEISPALIRHATGLLKDPAGAQDVVQATLIAIWQQREALPQTTGQLRAYCFGVLANQARMHLRSESTRHGYEAAAGEARRADTQRQYVPAIAIEAWELAMQLPEPEREVVALRYGMGLTLEETATALQLPVGTVSTRQRAGLGQLRHRLEPRLAALGLPVPAMLVAGDSFGELEQILAAGGGVPPTTSVAASAAAGESVFRFLEATLMSTSSGSKTAALTAVILLLLTGMVGAIAWVLFSPPGSNGRVPHVQGNAATAAGDGQADDPDSRHRTARDGSVPDGQRDGATDTGAGGATDRNRSAGEIDGGNPVDATAGGDEPTDTAERDAVEDPDGSGTGLTGRVLDPDGKPVAGVAVSATVKYEAIAGDTSAMAGAARETVRVTTNEAGYFTIGGMDHTQAWLLRIAATQTTLPYRQQAPALVAGQIVDLGRIDLIGTAAITGIVRDARGNPVAGAIVRIGEPLPTGIEYIYSDDGEVSGMQSFDASAHEPDDPIHEEMARSANTPPHLAAVVSAADGSFRLRMVPPGEHVVSAHKRGHSDALNFDVRVTAGSTTGPIELRLGEALSCEITVRNADGHVVPEAIIGVASGPGARWRAEYSPQYRVTTAADGRATIRGIENRELALYIRAEGYVKAEVAVRLNERGLTARDVTLLVGGGIRGKVVDADGNAVEGVRILLRPKKNGGMFAGSTHTDPDGDFLIAALEPGMYQIETSSNGQFAGIPPNAWPVVDGETTDVGRIVLPAYATLRVLVLDQNDHPVPTARVRAHTGFEGDATVNLDNEYDYRQAFTNGDGIATIETVEPGMVTVRALIEGGVESGIDIRVHPGDQDVTVRLASEAGRIEGVAKKADGSPLTNARIHLFRAGWGTQLAAHTRSDGQGRFAFGNLQPGRWGVSTEWYGVSSATGEWVDVVAGQTATATATDRRITLRIELRNADGSPAAGMPIAIGYASPGPNGSPMIAYPDHTGRTDHDGCVTIEGVQIGTSGQSVEVLDRDSARHVWRVPAINGPSHDMVLQLPLPASASVGGALNTTVVNTSGQPVNGARVEVTGRAAGEFAPQFRRELSTRSDGRLELDRMAPGSYQLTIRAHRLATVRRQVVIRDDSGIDLGRIEMVPAGVIRLSARSANPHDAGRPVAYHVSAGQSFGQTTLHGTIGYPMVINDLPAGAPCRIVATADGYQPAEVTVTPSDGADDEPTVIELIEAE